MVVEVIHGEGGADAKRFALELAVVYEKYAARKGLKTEELDGGEGHVVLRVSGKGAGRLFGQEAGKHCVQRVPCNSDTRQTSFVTVAVLPLPPAQVSQALPQGELEVTTQTGRQRAGGQHANKTASAVRMKHRPTGLTVFINGRCQHTNRKEALRVLTAKVNAARNGSAVERYVGERSDKLSDRGRGGKVRTYNFIDGFAVDHRNGKRTGNLKGLWKGELEALQ